MKPLQGDTVMNKNCSCTSCTYQSESDRQASLKRMQAQGLKNDRLYNCKNLSLRESKLIDKLMRTRALYDDVRNLLLSTSINSKADLEPRDNLNEQKRILGNANNSSDLLALVDLVDKVAVLGSRKLSECCSCCLCSSKIHLRECAPRIRKSRQAYARYFNSRSSVNSKYLIGQDLKLIKLKAKNIKSDPCTCTCSCGSEEYPKSRSRVLLKKMSAELPMAAIARDRLLTSVNKHKLMALNSDDKQRKMHYKLKRPKLYPGQYVDSVQRDDIKTGNKYKLSQDADIPSKMLAKYMPKDNFIPDENNIHNQKRVSFPSLPSSENTAELTKKDKIRQNDIERRELVEQKFKEQRHKLHKYSQSNNKLENASSSTLQDQVDQEFDYKEAKTSPEKAKRKLIPASMNTLKDKITKKHKGLSAVPETNQNRKVQRGSLALPSKRPVKSMTSLPSSKLADITLKKGDHLLQDPKKRPGTLLKSVSTSSLEKSFGDIKEKRLRDRSTTQETDTNWKSISTSSMTVSKDTRDRSIMKRPYRVLKSVSTSSIEKVSAMKNRGTNLKQTIRKKSSSSLVTIKQYSKEVSGPPRTSRTEKTSTPPEKPSKRAYLDKSPPPPEKLRLRETPRTEKSSSRKPSEKYLREKYKKSYVDKLPRPSIKLHLREKPRSKKPKKTDVEPSPTSEKLNKYFERENEEKLSSIPRKPASKLSSYMREKLKKSRVEKLLLSSEKSDLCECIEKPSLPEKSLQQPTNQLREKLTKSRAEKPATSTRKSYLRETSHTEQPSLPEKSLEKPTNQLREKLKKSRAEKPSAPTGKSYLRETSYTEPSLPVKSLEKPTSQLREKFKKSRLEKPSTSIEKPYLRETSHTEEPSLPVKSLEKPTSQLREKFKKSRLEKPSTPIEKSYLRETSHTEESSFSEKSLEKPTSHLLEKFKKSFAEKPSTPTGKPHMRETSHTKELSLPEKSLEKSTSYLREKFKKSRAEKPSTPSGKLYLPEMSRTKKPFFPTVKSSSHLGEKSKKPDAVKHPQPSIKFHLREKHGMEASSPSGKPTRKITSHLREKFKKSHDKLSTSSEQLHSREKQRHSKQNALRRYLNTWKVKNKNSKSSNTSLIVSECECFEENVKKIESATQLDKRSITKTKSTSIHGHGCDCCDCKEKLSPNCSKLERIIHSRTKSTSFDEFYDDASDVITKDKLASKRQLDRVVQTRTTPTSVQASQYEVINRDQFHNQKASTAPAIRPKKKAITIQVCKCDITDKDKTTQAIGSSVSIGVPDVGSNKKQTLNKAIEPEKQSNHVAQTKEYAIKYHPTKYRLRGKSVSKSGTKLASKQQNTIKPQSKRVRDKQSLISSATRMTKYSTTKHGLRRCVCSLKLGKVGKLNYYKNIHQSEIPYRKDSNGLECGSDFCIPRYCEPSECEQRWKEIKVKKPKTRSVKNTKKLRKRSYSSLTSQSLQLAKTKKVHSMLNTHKSDMPIPKLTETIHKVRTSFALNFLKKKSSFGSVSLVPNGDTKSKIERQIRHVDNSSNRMDKVADKHKTDKVSRMGPFKKCLQNILKLNTKDKYKMKERSETKLNSRKEKMYPDLEKLARRSIIRYSSKLKPYECEPNTCIPQKCGQYECLDRMKRSGSMRRSKNLGVVTPKTKMLSKSSDTRKLAKSSKDIIVRRSITRYSSKLKSYECEPNTCIPQKCGQYECLDRIKRSGSMRRSKDLGVVTPKTKMISKSSDTRKLAKSSKDIIARRSITRYSSKLKSYECEPNNCIPQKCGQYECLDRIKRSGSMRRSKDLGVVTPKTKMISKSSDTRKLAKSSKDINIVKSSRKLATSKPINIAKSSNTQKLAKSSKAIHVLSDSNVGKTDSVLRKGVRIGSTISFNIKFSKDVFPENEKMKETPRNISFGPMLKKCLCSLKLLNKSERYLQKTPFEMQKPTQIYTVSTITTAKGKFNSPKKFLQKSTELCSTSIEPYYLTNIKKNGTQNDNFKYLKTDSLSSILSLSAFSFTKSKKVKSYFRKKRRLLRVRPMDDTLLPMTSNDTTRFESKFSSQVIYLNGVRSDKQTYLKASNSQARLLAPNQCIQTFLENGEPKNFERRTPIPTDLTGIGPLLKRCYCTMNIKVAGHPELKKKLKRHRKLLDYECEPGVCIPDECDPYECKKLIDKRLRKKHSKTSATDTITKASSSSTNVISKRRKIQSKPHGKRRHSATKSEGVEHHERKKHIAKVKPVGVKYQVIPENDRKQAVRVGSSFSFNIEFSKSHGDSTKPLQAKHASHRKKPVGKRLQARDSNPRTSSVGTRLRPEYSSASQYSSPSDYRVHKGTKGRRPHRHHMESQATIKQMHHRGSNISPGLKRCFCTLKFQKMGHQFDKDHDLHLKTHGTTTPPKLNKEKHIMKTAETGTKPRHRCLCDNKLSKKLLPYECEPGICIPGECDPEECLELIKQRTGKHGRDFGTHAIRAKSTSSMTYYNPRHRKARHVQSKQRHLKHVTSRDTVTSHRRVKPIRSRDTIVRSKPSVMSIERQQLPSRRQSVRIGSNFSFNIEFYKDTGPISHAVEKRAPEPHINKQVVSKSKGVKKVAKRHHQRSVTDHPKKKLKESGAQYGRRTHETDSQVTVLKHAESTTAGGFLKRCFCTAKLFGIKMVDKKTKTTKPIRHVPPAPLERRVVNTQTHERKYRPHHRVLEPYECEPGVCVPYQCDPYECQKLIQRRLAKEKMTGTRRPRTRSTSLGFSSSRSSMAGFTQTKKKKPKKQLKNRLCYCPDTTIKERPKESLRGRSEGSSRERIHKKRVKEVPTVPSLPGRQAVRIGSSFSFDIEFYKDKTNPKYQEIQAAAAVVKKTHPRKPHRDQSEQSVSHYGPKMRHHATRHRPRYREQSEQSIVTRYNHKAQMNYPKRVDKALGPILRRCFCTLQLQKRRKHVKHKKEIKHHIRAHDTHKGTVTPFRREIPTLQHRSVMTVMAVNKVRHKLLPYDYEPGVCIPGECDPYECEKRINRRLRTRALETEHYRTKSASYSMVSHTKLRDSESQFAAKHATKQVKVRPVKAKPAKGKPLKVAKPHLAGKESVQNERRQQVVKIGSNFSFDVDFSKNVNDSSRAKSANRYEAKRETKRTDSISSPRHKTPPTKAARYFDSQVVAQRMHTTMTGLTPFLKRCFCTLQLHKTTRNRGPFSANVDEPAYNKKHQRKLEPYECEPGVCIPGECDPYECEKRIRRRMHSQQSGTELHPGRSVSSGTITSTRRRRKIQAHRDHSPRSKVVTSHRVEEHDDDHDTCRIGSNINFNIEFYKDCSSKVQPLSRPTQEVQHKEIQHQEIQHNVPKHLQHKYVQHRLAQRTEESMAHLFKRCCCTLKLLRGRQHHYTKIKRTPSRHYSAAGTQLRHKEKIHPQYHVTGTQLKHKEKIHPHYNITGTQCTCKEIHPTAREIGMVTKKHGHLLPYECEPGVCVPGHCDPYECEKLIKLRNMRHMGTDSLHGPRRTTSSLTTICKGDKEMNTHKLRTKPRKERHSPETVHKVKHRPVSEENLNRRSCRYGSNLSLNIEFFKDCSTGRPTHYKEVRSASPAEKRVKCKALPTHTDKHTAHQGTHSREVLFNHKRLQATPKMDSRGSGVLPLLKRCFCTLALHRGAVKHTEKAPKIVHTPSKADTHDKTTSTKKRYRMPPPPPLPHLEPYECEPGVCIPGQCDPYECLERIKRRGIRRMSRSTGTRMKRPSLVSISSMASQLMPGHRTKKIQYHDNCPPPRKVQRIVEQPRFPFLHSGNVRKGVKICSNFNFDIEFYEENLLPVVDPVVVDEIHPKHVKRHIEHKAIGAKKPKHAHHGTRHHDFCEQDSQSDIIRTEDKSSAVGLLRRCFCTAKLHKRHHHDTRHHPYAQTYTVGQVKETKLASDQPASPFGPHSYWVQYHTVQPDMCKSCYRSKKYRATNKIKHPGKLDTMKCTCKDDKPNENLKTIGKYQPKKKEKNVIPTKQKVTPPKQKIAPPKQKEKKKAAVAPQPKKDEKRGDSSTFKKMICRCKDIFTKHNKKNEVAEHKKKELDVLKPSKSERYPCIPKFTDLRQSKSLKLTSVLKKDKPKAQRKDVAKVTRKEVPKVSKKDRNKMHRMAEHYVCHDDTTFSHFQSGDADHMCHDSHVKHGLKLTVKPKIVQTMKQVHFDLSNQKIKEEKEHLKKYGKTVPLPTLYLNQDDLQCFQLCSCCGGYKKKKPTSLFDKMIHDKVDTFLSETKKKPCACCICKKRQQKKKTSAETKTTVRAKTKDGAKTKTCDRKKIMNKVKSSQSYLNLMKLMHPCVCGSAVCKKHSDERLAKLGLLSRKKVCKCGTKVCASESKKEFKTIIADYKRGLRKKKLRKQYQKMQAKALKLREAKYRKEDKILYKKRHKQDKYDLKQLKKYRDTKDLLLIADSILDISKLGLKSAKDILLFSARSIFDPRYTYKNLKLALLNPVLAWKKFQEAADKGAGVATLKRLKLRWLGLSFVKKGQEELESHPVTNYILHANEKDPSKKLRKRRRRRRPDITGNCSPLLMSLRKKPWLSIYYNCSWFYPHCLSILQVVRQFTDVILFILAVTVWCPCIAAMEIGRFLMCCLFCMG